jgi:hypothetical protein|tara:strand:+ start:1630 stop:2031 length:402 start_codon:yes stop_codon:yes gene_type:complete
MKTQLLATFTTKKDLDDIVKIISSTYEIVFDKIYVLQNEDNIDELICTYNIDSNKTVDFNDVKGTISLHRKKHTNTLYTINALNECIKNLNNGVLDKDFTVPWENFRNMILVTNAEGLSKIPTRIYKIKKISE